MQKTSKRRQLSECQLPYQCRTGGRVEARARGRQRHLPRTHSGKLLMTTRKPVLVNWQLTYSLPESKGAYPWDPALVKSLSPPLVTKIPGCPCHCLPSCGHSGLPAAFSALVSGHAAEQSKTALPLTLVRPHPCQSSSEGHSVFLSSHYVVHVYLFFVWFCFFFF